MISDLIPSLEKILKKRNTRKVESFQGSIQASVLMILKEFDNKHYIFFIKRSTDPRDSFSGHIAFPGGMKDFNDDNLIETALRETHEEVGIDIHKYGRIIGELDDVNPFTRTLSHYIVTPYVSILENDVEPKINLEVEKYMWIPVSHLKDKQFQELKIRNRKGVDIEDYNFFYNEHVIWGMTGRILNQFLEETGHLFDE